MNFDIFKLFKVIKKREVRTNVKFILRLNLEDMNEEQDYIGRLVNATFPKISKTQSFIKIH